MLKAILQGGIVPHLLLHGASVFSELIQGITLFNRILGHTWGMLRLFSNPNLHGSIPIQSPFTTHKLVWGTYSNVDPHWHIKNTIHQEFYFSFEVSCLKSETNYM